MRQPNLLLLLSSSASLALASIPRGVSPEGTHTHSSPSLPSLPTPQTNQPTNKPTADSKLYAASPENTFTCLTHRSVSIAHSHINDDYCDCPDGSDEPGTSACSHLLHSSLSIPGFYCRNKDHVPAYLPLSRVNDGICDYELCCDGSDEYAGAGGVKCENRCGEIGKAARGLKAQREKLRSEGVGMRAELVARAKVLRRELELDVQATRAKIGGVVANVQALEKALKETEERERERERAVKKLKEGSKIGTLVLGARERSEKLKSSLERVKGERDSAIERLVAAEGILAALKEGYNPNFNDEGVKTAVRAWEEYLAQDATGAAPEESDLETLLAADPIDWDEFLETDVEPDREFPQMLQLTIRY